MVIADGIIYFLLISIILAGTFFGMGLMGKNGAHRIFDFWDSMLSGVYISMRKKSDAWFDLKTVDSSAASIEDISLAMSLKDEDLSDYDDLEIKDVVSKRRLPKPIALAAVDGSLVTLIRLSGMYDIDGPEEVERRQERFVEGVGRLFSSNGHFIEVAAYFDPNDGYGVVKRAQKGLTSGARRLGLNMDFLFVDQRNSLRKYIADQYYTIALWTTPAVLSKVNRESGAKKKIEAIRELPVGIEASRLTLHIQVYGICIDLKLWD
jgi:hypothetical protein